MDSREVVYRAVLLMPMMLRLRGGPHSKAGAASLTGMTAEEVPPHPKHFQNEVNASRAKAVWLSICAGRGVSSSLTIFNLSSICWTQLKKERRR